MSWKENDMQFVMLIYHGSFPLPGTPAHEKLSDAEKKQIYADYAAINQEKAVGHGMPPMAPGKATTVTVKDGKPVVKESTYQKETLGGAFVYEAPNLEAAIAMAARIPQARLGGAVEIRPVEKYF
jgi:hypothetical protein